MTIEGLYKEKKKALEDYTKAAKVYKGEYLVKIEPGISLPQKDNVE